MTGKSKQAIFVLREQLKAGHQFLEGTMADVTEQEAHWAPPGGERAAQRRCPFVCQQLGSQGGR